jgi:hypothetical protein
MNLGASYHGRSIITQMTKRLKASEEAYMQAFPKGLEASVEPNYWNEKAAIGCNRNVKNAAQYQSPTALDGIYVAEQNNSGHQTPGCTL